MLLGLASHGLSHLRSPNICGLGPSLKTTLEQFPYGPKSRAKVLRIRERHAHDPSEDLGVKTLLFWIKITGCIILGLYRDIGKENGNCYSILRFYRCYTLGVSGLGSGSGTTLNPEP